jgi:hypothetical protein
VKLNRVSVKSCRADLAAGEVTLALSLDFGAQILLERARLGEWQDRETVLNLELTPRDGEQLPLLESPEAAAFDALGYAELLPLWPVEPSREDLAFVGEYGRQERGLWSAACPIEPGAEDRKLAAEYELPVPGVLPLVPYGSNGKVACLLPNDCRACGGTGWKEGSWPPNGLGCPNCHGTGKVPA